MVQISMSEIHTSRISEVDCLIPKRLFRRECDWCIQLCMETIEQLAHKISHLREDQQNFSLFENSIWLLDIYS